MERYYLLLVRVRSAALRDALAGALALLPALVVGPTTTCGGRRAIIPGQRVALARGYAELP